MITVYFKKEHTGKTTKFANQARNIASKCFRAIEEARAFAKTVEFDSAYNNIGKRVALMEG